MRALLAELAAKASPDGAGGAFVRALAARHPPSVTVSPWWWSPWR